MEEIRDVKQPKVTCKPDLSSERQTQMEIVAEDCCKLVSATPKKDNRSIIDLLELFDLIEKTYNELNGSDFITSYVSNVKNYLLESYEEKAKLYFFSPIIQFFIGVDDVKLAYESLDYLKESIMKKANEYVLKENYRNLIELYQLLQLSFLCKEPSADQLLCFGKEQLEASPFLNMILGISVACISNDIDIWSFLIIVSSYVNFNTIEQDENS